jgi:hypothetical protein
MATKKTKAPPALRLVKKPALDTVYQLKIVLAEVRPQIWRRVLVSGSIRLSSLHDVIQIVMGWQECHLHEFQIGDEIYGVPDPDALDARPTKNEHKVRLAQVAQAPKDRLGYLYDFGDSWQHIITVEKILPHDGGKYPRCIAGKRNGAPEDCGGTWGYQNLLKILKSPQHPEHEDMLEWVGGSYDPEHFDIDAVNQALAVFRV